MSSKINNVTGKTIFLSVWIKRPKSSCKRNIGIRCHTQNNIAIHPYQGRWRATIKVAQEQHSYLPDALQFDYNAPKFCDQ